MNKANRLKLFLMMVLEIAIWGAWFPLIFGYLPSMGFDAGQQSWILNTFPIAAIVGMFFSNQFADRNFAAEKFLAVSHVIGGLAMIGLAFIQVPAPVEGLAAGAANPNAPFWPFFSLMLVHCLLYVPTISITNSIAFAHMKDPQKEFGIVRMGGTIGWILAAWPFTFILVDYDKVNAANAPGFIGWLGTVLGSPLAGDALVRGTKATFIVAGVVSLLLAAFSLTLPHTPPKRVEAGAESKLAWLEAVKLLGIPFILILWLVTFVDATVHNLFFNWTGRFLGTPVEAGGVGIPGNWIMPVMSIGQVAEILTMLVLGATLKKLGWRTTMIIGILGHAARFAVFAFMPQHKEVIILVNLLHGICYAFFFATVYIFVDEFFPKDARASAQGLFNLMILGLGPLVANAIGPKLIGTTFNKGGVVDFKGLFLIPCIAAIVAAVVLALFFRPPKSREPQASRQPATPH
ncbi:MAG TPA: MFS transporter [Methylomirabilota bacterium]|nr:MFS transporter [Methylomirabilota bacterium]